MRVRLQPGAAEDLASACDGYESQVPGRGLDLTDEVPRTLDAVSERPGTWPLWPGDGQRHGSRWAGAARWCLVAATLAFSSAGRAAPPASSPDGFDLPSRPAAGAPLRLWATEYRVHEAAEARGGVPLLDLRGRTVGPTLSPADWCRAALEGTVRAVPVAGPPVLLNFEGRAERLVDCAPHFPAAVHRQIAVERLGRARFRPSRGPFGDGVEGYRLVPYRTVAVDPRAIPYGSVLYVPSARGTPLPPDGGAPREHDGYFFAADTGTAIRGNHVDVFLGTAADNPFGFVLSRAEQTFEAFVVPDPAIGRRLARLHGRGD